MTGPALYLVEGHTGEYSDRSQWLVAACLTRAAADALADRCFEWARAFGMSAAGSHRSAGLAAIDNTDNYELRYDITRAIESGFLPEAPDQSMRCDYTGVDYVVIEAPLRLTEQDLEEFMDAAVAWRAEARAKATP